MTTKPPYDLRERTFRFACRIVPFCRKLSAEPGVVRQIAWQLAAAGTSVAANYEEAKGAWLRLILECQLASEEEVRPLFDEANQR